MMTGNETAMQDFTGKVIVITGGASGIGRAAALLAHKAGARVVILDLDSSRTLSAARETQGLGIPCDVSNEEEVSRVFGEIERQAGAPSGVIAAAGIDQSSPVSELDAALWRSVLSTNLDGAFYTAKHAIASMRRNQVAGSIVLVSSPAAFVAFAAGGASAYAASKGGVSALTRCLALECAPDRIRVNALVPGATETAMMWHSVPAAQIPSVRPSVESEIPLGRLANPEEPARAALWLLSSEASYVTGSHLVCDGGVLAKASISF
jgi:NAD(P)-dependent dehydrogenase (short-subunit alcohol dehydrogenase family)